MTLDPRFNFWLSVALAILGVFSSAGSQFLDLGLSPATVKAVVAGDILLLGVGNAINAVLAAIPGKDNTTGFYLAPKDPPPK
jgi:hypothetical protein